MLVRAVGDEQAIAPLRAELQVLEWRVVELEAGSAIDASLRELGTLHHALAVLRVQVQPLGVELWLSESRSAASQQLHVAAQRDAHALAVHVVEMLRARWAELGVGSGARAREADPSPEPTRAAIREPPAPLLWIGAGAALLLSPQPFDPQPSGYLNLALEPHDLVAASLFGLLPVMSSSVHEPEGRADIDIWSVGATVSVRIDGPIWGAAIGGGAMLCWLRVHGTANAPFESEDQGARVRSAHFSGAVGAHITSGLRLRASALLGLGLEEASILMVGRTVARWGKPFGAGTLSLELAVPGT